MADEWLCYHKLISAWVNGEFATFSHMTIAFFDTVVMFATIKGWECGSGAEFRIQMRQKEYVNRVYNEEAMKEFKDKLEHPEKRFKLVGVAAPAAID
jgi:hypothetical protein